jgi:hypothetical protein
MMKKILLHFTQERLLGAEFLDVAGKLDSEMLGSVSKTCGWKLCKLLIEFVGRQLICGKQCCGAASY